MLKTKKKHSFGIHWGLLTKIYGRWTASLERQCDKLHVTHCILQRKWYVSETCVIWHPLEIRHQGRNSNLNQHWRTVRWGEDTFVTVEPRCEIFVPTNTSENFVCKTAVLMFWSRRVHNVHNILDIHGLMKCSISDEIQLKKGIRRSHPSSNPQARILSDSLRDKELHVPTLWSTFHADLSFIAHTAVY